MNLPASVRKKLGLGAAPGKRPKRASKYGAKATVVDGIRFASAKEASHYASLAMMWRSGLIRWFCRQPRFALPGGVEYVADFIVVDLDGEVSVEDVKGFKTAEYRMKKKQVEAIYGIQIVEL